MSIARSFARSALVALSLGSAAATAQNSIFVADPPQFGPYNGTFLPDGPSLTRPIPDVHDPILLPDSPWTLFCWIKTNEPVDALSLVAGIGSPTAGCSRYLAVNAGKVTLWMGEANQLSGAANLAPNECHLLAASFDAAQFHVYADGRPFASGKLTLGTGNPVLQDGSRRSPQPPLRWADRFLHPAALCAVRQRDSAAVSCKAGLLADPVRGGIRALALSDTRPGRLPRATGSRHDAAFTRSRFVAGRDQTPAPRPFSHTDRARRVDALRWLDYA